MNADTLCPEMRLRLAEAFETLADLLEEETGRVSTAQTDGLDLYFNTKKRLFEQLGILMREANRAPALPVFPADPGVAVVDGTDGMDDGTDREADGEEPVDPAPPARVRAAAQRLRAATKANHQALQSAQEAVTAIAKRMASIAERQRTDGVYGRAGAASQRALPGYGRIDHNL